MLVVSPRLHVSHMACMQMMILKLGVPDLLRGAAVRWADWEPQPQFTVLHGEPLVFRTGEPVVRGFAIAIGSYGAPAAIDGSLGRYISRSAEMLREYKE